MRNRGEFKSVIALVLLILSFAAEAPAAGFLSLEPGESTIREFLLYEEFDSRQLGPAEFFLVLGTGDNETKLGDLTVTVKPAVTKDFGALLEYGLIGLVYPFGGKAIFANTQATAPLQLAKTVKTSSVWGLALVGIYIKNIDGDVLLPARFSITFKWAAAE